MANDKVAILLHQEIKESYRKTRLAYSRYGETLSIDDSEAQCGGQSLNTLSRIDKDIPIVANLEDSLA